MSDTAYAYPAGVLFVEDFDEAPAHADERPDIIAPTYTARDVEEAREEARLAGAEEARAEDQTIHAALCAAALAAIGDGLSRARADVAQIAQARAGDIAGAMLALLGAAMPATAARLAPQEIAALLDALLPPLAHMPEVHVRVHPSVMESLAARLVGISGIIAQPDEAMAPPDVVVTWQEGEARRNWTALWAQLCTALAPFGLPAAAAQDIGG